MAILPKQGNVRDAFRYGSTSNDRRPEYLKKRCLAQQSYIQENTGMELGLKNARVCISGGTKGMGYESALLFAREGARVT